VAGGGFVVALIGSVLVGFLGWPALSLVRPDLVGFVFGEPYRPMPAYTGLAVAALGVVAAWVLLVRRRVTAFECGGGVALTLALLTAVAAGAAPHAAYVFAWPALAAAAALAVAAGQPVGSPWRGLVWTAPGIVTALVLVPVTVLLFPTVGLADVGVALAFVSLVAGVAVAGLALPAPRPRVAAVVAAAMVLAGVALAGAGAAADPVDARHPRPLSLVYGFDADTGTATWLSPYPVAEPFVDRYVTEPGRPWTGTFPVLRSPRYRSGAGPVVTVPQPTIRIDGIEPTAGGRRVRLTLGADSSAATSLALYVDATTPVVGARVSGQAVPGGENRRVGDEWRWGFRYVGPLTEGVAVELTLAGSGPARLRAVASTPGLPARALDAPMPDTVTGAVSAAVQTLATRTAVV
jgi:hypothetical protein